MGKSPIDFYGILSGEPPDTVDVKGVVLAWNNKGKWHACKSDGYSISYVCGSGSPLNPNRVSYSGDDYCEKKYERSGKTVSPRQYLELDTVCKNCQRRIEDEYDFVRMVSAVPTDAPPDAWMDISDRFISRATKEIE